MSENWTEKLTALLKNLPAGSEPLAWSTLNTLLAHAHNQTGPFGQLLGVEFNIVPPEQCQASLEIQPHLLNRLGIVHGGVAYTLADTACGMAAWLKMGPLGMAVVTQDLHYRYHGAVQTGRITATAEVIHLGTRTLVTRALVHQGEQLIGSVTGTFAIVELEKLGIDKK